MSDDSQTENSEPKLVVDEGWKEQVKSENSRLDEQTKQESVKEADTAGAEAESAQQPQPKLAPDQLPPADFALLLSMLSTQAMVALGMLPHPVSEDAGPDLVLAKHFVDLLGILEEKTQGNLTDQEEALLSVTLHELRMRFVQLSKESTNPE